MVSKQQGAGFREEVENVNAQLVTDLLLIIFISVCFIIS